METLGMILMVVGWIIALAGSVWIWVLAFQESILWGLGCLFIPLVALIFVILHLQDTWKPLLINLGGLLLAFLGMTMSGR